MASWCLEPSKILSADPKRLQYASKWSKGDTSDGILVMHPQPIFFTKWLQKCFQSLIIVYRTKMMLGKVPGMDTKRSEIQSTGKKKAQICLKRTQEGTFEDLWWSNTFFQNYEIGPPYFDDGPKMALRKMELWYIKPFRIKTTVPKKLKHGNKLSLESSSGDPKCSKTLFFLKLWRRVP